jgi:membrane protein YdbS with pleckstrin-like domain
MKSWPIILVIATTLILVTATVFAAMQFPFRWVFWSVIVGQIALIATVFRVLLDNYTTEKTFEDFYEDHPIGKEEASL